MKIIKGTDILKLGESLANLKHIAEDASNRDEMKQLRTALRELVAAAERLTHLTFSQMTDAEFEQLEAAIEKAKEILDGD